MRLSRLSALAVAAAWLAVPAGAAPAPGLAVVIANGYDGFLEGATRDGEALADRLEQAGFTTIPMLGLEGAAIAARLDELRQAAAGAGPFRIVYATGFGICAGDDLVLLAEDVQPEMLESGEIGDAALPVSVLAEIAATGGGEALVVFDTTPNQCADSLIGEVKLPPGVTLLVTTSAGGDMVDEVEEGGRSAFVTAFLREFAPDRAPQEMLDAILQQIDTLTEGLQVPVVVGGF